MAWAEFWTIVAQLTIGFTVGAVVLFVGAAIWSVVRKELAKDREEPLKRPTRQNGNGGQA